MENITRKRKSRKQLQRKRRRRKLIRLFLIFILAFLILISLFLGFLAVRQIYQTFFNNADIVLDAGHGGKDPGANIDDSIEKEITLEIAMMTQEILENTGYKVAMTRTDDTFVELTERPVFANKKKSQVFVSIHCNSSEDGSGKGIETYYTEQEGTSSESLANEIQNAVIEHTSADNREVKTANYTVLVRSNMPTALVEVGFLTNSSERELLQTEEYQKNLAEGIAEGILNYIHQ